MSCEIFVTAWVVVVVIACDDLEHPQAARSEQDVVTAAGVFADREHGLALVGVQRVPCAQKNRIVVVDGSAS